MVANKGTIFALREILRKIGQLLCVITVIVLNLSVDRG